MKTKLAFSAGLAVGYVLGTRVGRRGYESLKKNARAFWRMDAVQDTVQTVEKSVKEESEKMGSRLFGGSTGDANEDSPAIHPASESVAGVHRTLEDVDSDPALNDAVGQDWADEGGALPSGPAS
ncbi:hypothetical protein AOC05_18115 [Arthrobacter alpinus]|uniref:YtxH domain-containing protein n=1 Tax=Arthrobacter alpinus TaxID=656366 RepID=A0A0M3UGV9_9MICC|nr:hypothetical protein [Arthrobacter alpinus]ALE93795.1 hypothetical protein AOC05_18115 [Arthrobacter alpinus]